MIVPLYSVLSKIFNKDNEKFSGVTFKIGLIVFVAYSIFSIGVLVYGSALVGAMNSTEIDLTVTSRYLRLETVAFMIGVVISFVNVVFVVVGKAKNVYLFLVANTVLSVIADFILIPNLGVYGIAVSNIIVNLLLSVLSIALLYLQGYIRPCKFGRGDLTIIKLWCKTGVFSGVQQFVDNLIYAVMICKMVNMVAEQGNYWIANNFMWGWLLIPITALAEIVKRDCNDGYGKLKQFNYYFVAGITIVLWAISIPLWTPFYRYAENLTNASDIFFITIKLMPFYIAYAGSVIIDSIFIGLGKTAHNAVNSLIVNFVYYGIFYVLYISGAITFTLNIIILMFGFGNVVHLGISLIQEKIFFER